MGPKTNREILTGGKRYHQKQVKKYGVDEVVFDRESRQEYLTGFHKRKLERKKKAQEYHKEQDRLAKISERKQLREERQRTFEEQLKQINEVKSFAVDSDDEDSDKKKVADSPEEKIESSEWTGFGEPSNEESSSSDDETAVRGILLRKTVYKIEDPETLGDAIVDDETTVTVETLENPRDAYLAQTSLDAIAKANNVNLNKLDEILEKLITRAKNYAVVCGVSKPKTKKKKFRYLTKSERQANNTKARLSKMKSRKRD